LYHTSEIIIANTKVHFLYVWLHKQYAHFVTWENWKTATHVPSLFSSSFTITWESGKICRYRSRLRAGRSQFDSWQDNFSSSPQCPQTGSGTHTVSYLMSTEGHFPGGRAAGVWSWPLTSI
jgi:hypothetical protein